MQRKVTNVMVFFINHTEIPTKIAKISVRCSANPLHLYIKSKKGFFFNIFCCTFAAQIKETQAFHDRKETGARLRFREQLGGL